jgi:hypothetical protein
MIVVVMILSAMTALAVVRLDFLVPKYRLRAATRQMASVLSQARSRAAAIGRDVYVRIHLSGEYEILVPMPKRSSPGSRRHAGRPHPPPEYEFDRLRESCPEGPGTST